MSKQLTLEGDEADMVYTRPSTFLWDDEEEEWVLRSKRAKVWPRKLYESKPTSNSGSSSSASFVYIDDGDDDDPGVVGGIYDIDLSYSVDFRFTIPAATEDQAKQRAKELVDTPSNCADMFRAHTSSDKRTDIYEDSEHLPDDWDPYGNTPLFEAYGSESDDDE